MEPWSRQQSISDTEAKCELSNSTPELAQLLVLHMPLLGKKLDKHKTLSNILYNSKKLKNAFSYLSRNLDKSKKTLYLGPSV